MFGYGGPPGPIQCSRLDLRAFRLDLIQQAALPGNPRRRPDPGIGIRRLGLVRAGRSFTVQRRNPSKKSRSRPRPLSMDYTLDTVSAIASRLGSTCRRC